MNFKLFFQFFSKYNDSWSDLEVGLKKKITALRKRMINYLGSGEVSWIEICRTNNILPFPLLIQYHIAILAFKVKYGLSQDVVWDQIPIHSTHPYPTRQSNLLLTPFVKLERSKQISNISLTTTWNKLPDSIKSINQLGRFQRALKIWLLQDITPENIFD